MFLANPSVRDKGAVKTQIWLPVPVTAVKSVIAGKELEMKRLFWRFFCQFFVKKPNICDISRSFRDSNPVKSSVLHLFGEKQMAKYQVDRDISYMKEKWGTTKLVTDYGALTPTNKTHKNDPPSNRLSRHCGGKNGFDDYVEWW